MIKEFREGNWRSRLLMSIVFQRGDDLCINALSVPVLVS